MARKALSRWREAADLLAQAREADWSNGARAEQAWAKLGATETELLGPVQQPGEFADKLAYLLRVTETPAERKVSVARKSWKHRLLHSAIEDAARVESSNAELARRYEALRRQVAKVAHANDLQEQLQATLEELEEARAERDAAHNALERLNSRGMAQGSIARHTAAAHHAACYVRAPRP